MRLRKCLFIKQLSKTKTDHAGCLSNTNTACGRMALWTPPSPPSKWNNFGQGQYKSAAASFASVGNGKGVRSHQVQEVFSCLHALLFPRRQISFPSHYDSFFPPPLHIWCVTRTPRGQTDALSSHELYHSFHPHHRPPGRFFFFFRFFWRLSNSSSSRGIHLFPCAAPHRLFKNCMDVQCFYSMNSASEMW